MNWKPITELPELRRGTNGPYLCNAKPLLLWVAEAQTGTPGIVIVWDDGSIIWLASGYSHKTITHWREDTAPEGMQ